MRPQALRRSVPSPALDLRPFLRKEECFRAGPPLASPSPRVVSGVTSFERIVCNRLVMMRARLLSQAEPSGPTGSSTTRSRRFDAALVRLEEGRFGICERCGRALGQHRLLAEPAARSATSVVLRRPWTDCRGVAAGHFLRGEAGRCSSSKVKSARRASMVVKTPTTRSFSITTAEPYLLAAISEATLRRDERGVTV